MNTLQYWPFTCEYSIWNATVTALQLWTADFEPHILSNAIDWVYAAFVYGDYTQQIQNLPEETLSGHFVTTQNDTFATELAQNDKGYESGSESLNGPTTLSRAPRIYHVSMVGDLSFNPANFGQSPTTLEQHAESSPHRYRGHSITNYQLVFISLDDESPVRPSVHHSQLSSDNDRSHSPRGADASSSVHHNLCHPIIPTPIHKTTPHKCLGWWYNFLWEKTSQQHHWMKMCGLKIQFQIDTCVSTRHLMSQITSVSILAHTGTPPLGWIYHSQHHRMKQYFTTIQWTSVTSHQIFQTSWWQQWQ